MASTDALPIPRKNIAYRVVFPIVDADGDLVTAAAGLDSEVSKDQGTFADCTNEATEIATSSGMYYLDLSSTEMNADCVAVIVKTSTTGAKTTPIVLYPLEDGDWRVNVVQWLSTAAATPATAGIPDVNTKNWNNLATVTLPLSPTTAGRALDVTTTGEAGIDWSNIGAPTTSQSLSGTTFALSPVNVTQWSSTNVASPDTAGYPKVTVKSGTGTGEISLSSGRISTTGNVKKNTAFAGFMFLVTDSTNHQPATGKTVTVTRSIDGAAFGAGSLSAVTEVGVGIYAVDFAGADLNGNNIILRATASSCDDTFERVVTLL